MSIFIGKFIVDALNNRAIDQVDDEDFRAGLDVLVTHCDDDVAIRIETQREEGVLAATITAIKSQRSYFDGFLKQGTIGASF